MNAQWEINVLNRIRKKQKQQQKRLKFVKKLWKIKSANKPKV